METLKKILNYILSPLEGKDGKPSIRRLLAVGFFYGLVRYVEKAYGFEKPIDSEVLWTFGWLICIMCGIVTVDNIVDRLPNLNKTKKNTDGE